MAALKRRYARNILLGVAGTLLLLSGGARADSVAATDSVEAVWKSHDLTFEYRGYNTLYACDALRRKLTKVLLNLGARRPPTMRAYACDDANGYARFQVSFDAPIEATPENVRELTTYDSREVLIARVQGTSLPTEADLQRFPATWKTISFSRDVRLGLDRSDCELVQQLRQKILPRMSIQVINTGRCSVFGNIGPPGLKVSALVADR